jgi:hypothetical protein
MALNVNTFTITQHSDTAGALLPVLPPLVRCSVANEGAIQVARHTGSTFAVHV